MVEPARVQIVGAPIACAGGAKDAWREVSAWVARQITARFGAGVRVDYYDLFDPDCPAVPAGATLPLVLVNGATLSSGGKISVPAIRRRLEELGTPLPRPAAQ